MLFLLLLSGESLKWARLSVKEQNRVAKGQIVLTVGVALAVVAYALLSLGFVRRGMKVIICQA